MARRKAGNINKDNFRLLITDLGYKLENGIGETYSKTYRVKGDYTIKIDFNNETINYVDETAKEKITVVRDTTSNFSDAENAVVLECVDRLLKLGYEPGTITLEKSFPNGHDATYLDIFVTKEDKAYLMIECKTFGEKYNTEYNNMLLLKRDGQPKGQLFAYYSAEQKNTKLLCLYTSRFENGRLERVNDIIEVREEWAKCGNVREVFDSWNKTFVNKGIFEDGCIAYSYENKGLLRNELLPLTKESATTIFHQFLEILRHNAVSDKPNAFNKMLNLFVCKIMDEDKQPDELLSFQWDEHTNYRMMMSNLEELYKQGMNQFLGIDVTDYSQNDLNSALVKLDEKEKQVVINMVQNLRLQKGSEFAFTEVYNEESFISNAKIVREIVEILQKWQFRYGHKQQFLGDFFEQLLATSIKQESGQFFTPLPIARFIVSSLPLKELTYAKAHDNNVKEILPVAIDYACGSGHFLTEYMDIEQGIINNYDINEKGLTNSAKKNLRHWQKTDNDNDLSGEFEWAAEHVYGIEKDYRLVKATKISTFLNGDGDANIIHADGLDKFSSEKYTGLLKIKNVVNGQNGHFDIVIANPPFSVNEFKKTLNSDFDDFTLYDLVTDKNDNIECMFIERTAQLLHAGDYCGYGAIVVPVSIMKNDDNLHVATRDIIFRKFHICALVRMRAVVFAKTSTETIILFLKRRDEIEYITIKNLVESFMSNFTDFAYNGRMDIVKSYLEDCCGGLDFEQYILFLSNLISTGEKYIDSVLNYFEDEIKPTIIKNKSFQNLSVDKQDQELESKRIEYVLSWERERLEDYLLLFADDIIVADSLTGDEGQDFIGYKFSEKRTRTGLRDRRDDDDNSVSKLYNDDDLWNDNTKLNYHIHSACIGIKTDIPSELEKHAEWQSGVEVLNWGVPFVNKINVRLTGNKKVRKEKQGYEDVKFGIITDSYNGDTSLSQTYISNHHGEYPVLSAKTLGDAVKGYIDTWKYDMECIQITTNGENSGTVVFKPKQKFSVGADTRVFTIKEEYHDQISIKYVYYAMRMELSREEYSWKNKSGKNVINSTNIHIPIKSDGQYDLDKQNTIVKALEKAEEKIGAIDLKAKNIEVDIMNKFYELFGDVENNDKKWPKERIIKKEQLKNGLNYNYDDNGLKIKSLGVGDFQDKYYIDNTDLLGEISLKQKPSEEYMLQDEDIVFVRSNGNRELVGRSVMVNVGSEPVSFSGFCIRYRNNNPEVDSVYLLYLLKTEYYRRLLHGDGANIKNLNQTILSSLDILVPPKIIQEEFSKYAKELEKKRKKIITQKEPLENAFFELQMKYL